MRKNGYNPVRRNRNIGTAKQGVGRNNAMRIPSVCHEERIWWENLGPHTLLERSAGSRTLAFLVERTREDCEHACSVDDICQILSLVPAEDIESLDTIILRQPTRKRFLFHSNLESVRATQLYRTLLHEVGHWVHWLRMVARPAEKSGLHDVLAHRFFAQPQKERELFAHQYADALRKRLIAEGRIPFARMTHSLRKSGDSR